MKFRIRFVDQVVGIFVLIALGALVAILILMGTNQRWFAKDYYFTSRFESASGLSVGMPITLKGFKIGNIDSIELNEENKVDVDFYIYDTYYEKVKPNSVLELASNPLGLGGGLRFHPGANSLAPLEENSFIPSLDLEEGKKLVKQKLVAMPEKDDAINAILSKVGPIMDKLDSTLVTVETLLTSVNDAVTGQAEGPINDIFTDVSMLILQVSSLIEELNTRISTVLDNTQGIFEDVDALFSDVDGIMENVDGITGNLEQTTDAFKDPTGLVTTLLDPKGSIATILDDDNVLFDQIQSILERVNGTIDQLQDFTGYINDTTPQISGLLEKSKEALDKGKDVLEGLRNNPLLRGGITQQKEQASTFQSYRDEDF